MQQRVIASFNTLYLENLCSVEDFLREVFLFCPYKNVTFDIDYKNESQRGNKMMKLSERHEGILIYKAIEYKREIEKNDNGYIAGRFDGLVEAIAADLKTSIQSVLRLINQIERGA